MTDHTHPDSPAAREEAELDAMFPPGIPTPPDYPRGLEQLKLWAHQYAAGQRISVNLREIAPIIAEWEAERRPPMPPESDPEDPQELAALKALVRDMQEERDPLSPPAADWMRKRDVVIARAIGKWMAERQAHDEYVALAKHTMDVISAKAAEHKADLEQAQTDLRIAQAQADDAQARCDRAQDRVAELEAHDAATSAIADEARQAARDHGVFIEAIRLPMKPTDRRGPTTLSDECIERIAHRLGELPISEHEIGKVAERTAALVAERAPVDVLADDVAKALVKRCGPPIGAILGESLKLVQAAAGAALQAMKVAAAEPGVKGPNGDPGYVPSNGHHGEGDGWG